MLEPRGKNPRASRESPRGNVSDTKNRKGNPIHSPTSYAVDRKTLFDDGLLAMTSNGLILYSSDERDELLRIPLSQIVSCKYSMMRRKLVVKHRVREDENLQSLITQQEREIADLELQKNELVAKRKNTRDKQKRQQLASKIEEIKLKLNDLAKTKNALEHDPATIQHTRNDLADIEDISFRLSDSSRDEYRIWEHVINRRVYGMERLKIETTPYGAIVLINGVSAGTTPLTVDKPLVDKAILSGRYDVSILLEGHKMVNKSVHVGFGGNSDIIDVELSQANSPDADFDSHVAKLRQDTPTQTVDLSQCGVIREEECLDENIEIASDALLIVSKSGDDLYYEIPYGAITDIRYEGGFLGRLGNKRICIEYDEPDYKGQVLEMALDDRDGTISGSEIRRRGESLVQLVHNQRGNTGNNSTPRRRHNSQHYVITEQDIKNNFQRFEPLDFETVVMKLFEKKGYNASVGPGRGDFGVDVLAKSGNNTIVIQVKKWSASVGGPDVHKTLGSMHAFSANQAIVVTTADFTRQAYEIQNKGAPVELWNGEKLRDEIRKHMLNAPD